MGRGIPTTPLKTNQNILRPLLLPQAPKLREREGGEPKNQVTWLPVFASEENDETKDQ